MDQTLNVGIESEKKYLSAWRWQWGVGVLAVVLVVVINSMLMTESRESDGTLYQWKAFSSEFILPNGRVVDNVNSGISHSEGQGYAMILAEHWDDRETFDRVWQWTRKNLQVRNGDLLFSWKWEDSATGGGVTDFNNASDGDVLIAWGLCRAYWNWGANEYLSDAVSICQSIRSNLARQSRHGTILLPGAEGFEHPDKTVVNLSYWVFPAFRDLAKIDGKDEFWGKLTDSGFRLVALASQDDMDLPPDWIELGPGSLVHPAKDWEPVFGYNAIRIPLHLGWVSEDRPVERLLMPFSSLPLSYEKGELPARIPVDGSTLESEVALPGMKRVLEFSSELSGGSDNLVSGDPPPLEIEHGYYSSALHLLTQCAMDDVRAARESRAENHLTKL